MIVDCANGIGAQSLKNFLAFTDKYPLEIDHINTDDAELLNSGCGSDFVQGKGILPRNFNFGPEIMGASLDGDADRSVF